MHSTRFESSMRFTKIGLAALLVVGLIPASHAGASSPDPVMPGASIGPVRPVHTFSIVARDPKTGEMGAAVQSHYFSVGPVVPWAEAGVGAICTQSLVDISYGPKGLELMRSGKAAADALSTLILKDDKREVRQVAMIDAKGNAAAWTGPRCIEAAGQEVGTGSRDFSVQANLMANDTVWPAMARAYREATGDLADRMLAALEAGQKAGGDIRGMQSAAIVVVKGTASQEPWKDRLFDLRVEDSPRPIEELKRLVRLRRAYRLEDEGDDAVAAGKMDEALKAYSEAARLAPEVPELVFWQAVSLFSAGQEAQAMPLFKTVFAADHNWAVLVPRLVPPGLLTADEEGLARIAAVAASVKASPAPAKKGAKPTPAPGPTGKSAKPPKKG
jgi:uncharacterized Ntn-hydrolase superfamily protein